MSNFFSFARRAFAIFYTALPFIVFSLLVVAYWQHPDPALTDPTNGKFNEFQKPADWNLVYSFWHVLPTLPLLIWPVPIALWLYRHPPTLSKGIGVALSFFVFLLAIFISMLVASMMGMGGGGRCAF
ncbi:MAG: hypothetical protein LBH14_02340 [Desulfobulbaceae bacterium]|nr:hypothetical protein [Desulfobulbaceae bacterium]